MSELSPFESLIPRPLLTKSAPGNFTLAAGTRIFIDPASPEMYQAAQALGEILRPGTGATLPVLTSGTASSRGGITLTTTEPKSEMGAEGYELEIYPDEVILRANTPAGLFYAMQTMRQLLPPGFEKVGIGRLGLWKLPAGVVRDRPRFAWRGMMLDVARHFFSVDEVKRCIDLVSRYKMNRFHLHLTDDQGWRIQIDSWPELARKGGSTSVNNDPAGFYTKDDYCELVKYAARRFVTLVPEIDMPGHTNAALACYPELNKDGIAPALYTGTEVGFSTFHADKEVTYRFIDDVVRELAEMTPGPYIHIGGDEAHSTPPEAYPGFIERVQEIVNAHGKQMVGWEEIGRVKLRPNSIAQAWKDNSVLKAAAQGAKAILSPAYLAYLDMQYDENCPLGLSWAGFVEVDASYSWEPGEVIEGLGESSILGVEGCLWTETVRTMADIEYLTFPRLPGLAELGWSPAGHKWEEYRQRLAVHGERCAALGIHFYRSPVVEW